jgi:hypothetical protein
MRNFRRGGPLKLTGMDLETKASVHLVMRMLCNAWVSEKQRSHVQDCLLLAKHNKEDVVDQQVFYEKRSRDSEVFISHVSIRKSDRRQVSTIASMSSDDVYEWVKSLGGGRCPDYASYAKTFRKKGVNGVVLGELTDDTLKAALGRHSTSSCAALVSLATRMPLNQIPMSSKY